MLCPCCAHAVLKCDEAVMLLHDAVYTLCGTDVKKCPGWTPTSCGRIHKDQPGDYWMHRCNPLAVPKNDTATVLSCKPQAVNGTYQCYFGQVRCVLHVQPAFGGCNTAMD